MTKKENWGIYGQTLIIKGSSKNVIPAPISIGINSSWNPEPLVIIGLISVPE